MWPGVPRHSCRLGFTRTWTRGTWQGVCIYGETQSRTGCLLETAPSPKVGQCLSLLPTPDARTTLGLLAPSFFPQLAYTLKEPLGVKIQEGSKR